MRKSFVSILWKLEAFVRQRQASAVIPFTPFSLYSEGDYHFQWNTIWLIYCKSNLNSHVSLLFKCKREVFTREKCRCGNALQKIKHRWKLYRPHSSIPGGYWEQAFRQHLGPRLPTPLPGPMRVESVTTVGFSIVNISLTCRPASLGDCPAFSPLLWSCCSN